MEFLVSHREAAVTNQPDIVVVEDAEDCRFDRCDNNIRKDGKMEKYQGLQEPLEQV